MTHFVYILKSDRDGKYYIGSSKDPIKRLGEHNSGKTKSLKNRLPMKLIFSQPFKNGKEAKFVEYKLKKHKSKTIIEKILLDQEIKITNTGR